MVKRILSKIPVIIIAAVILFAGCDGRDNHDSGDKELLLYCGAGIRPPIEELTAAFEKKYDIRIITDYAGSEVLLSKIRLVHKGDLYMPGDKHYVELAENEAMIISKRTVCYWMPTILVQKHNPKNIHSLKDLLKPGLKIGMGDPNACAIGRTTKRILNKSGISFSNFARNLVYQSLTVNELGMQIQVKSVDAVIVWDVIAKYYSQYGDEVPIAFEQNIISTVDIGLLKFTEHKQLAEKFMEFIISKQGKAIFDKYNYSTQSPR